MIASLLSSLAYALTVTSTSPQSNLIPPGMPGQIVFSVRNTSATTLTIASIVKAVPVSTACSAYTDPPVAILSNFGDPIAPGKQQQFVVTTPGINPMTQGPCTYSINTSAGVSSLTINFRAAPNAGSAVKVELQPIDMVFSAPIGSNEDQATVLTNYESTDLAGYTVKLTNPSFTFVGGTCDGMTMCQPPTITTGNYLGLTVRCRPTAAVQTGQMQVFESGAMGSGSAMAIPLGAQIATTNLSCNGVMTPPQLHFIDDPIAISAPVNMTGTSSTTLENLGGSAETLHSISITGTDSAKFGFTDTTSCTGQTCNFTPGILVPPSTMIGVTCHPVDTTTMLTATITAVGSASTAVSHLACQGTAASAPVMSVSPPSITAHTIPVGAMDTPTPNTVMIRNIGTLPLQNVQVTIAGMGSADWQMMTPCTPPAGCTIANGSATSFPVFFTPKTHGDRMATLQVHASNYSPDKFLDLIGTANGGVLAITAPIPNEINFGTLPRNQLSQQDVTAANTGNAMIFVNVTSPSPFSSTVSAGFSLPGSSSNTFKVGCNSPTAGMFDDTIAITSTQAYLGSAQAVAVRCTVAPIDVTVTPTDYAFGELFKGSLAKHKDIVVTNPTTMPVDITRLAITGSRPGLVLTGAITGTTTLAPNGGMVTANLTLDPVEETDLTGVNFEIDVQGSTLSYPVTGKVVHPHSTIAPAHLDLGTACVGTRIRGTEMLINDGTATLDVFTPVMDQGFTTMFNNPSTYPSKLAPGGHASVDLVPSTSVTGMLHGTLMWGDSVPNTYSVDVDLEYVSTGAALSPRALAFGTIDVHATSDEQTITLENCGLDPVQIKVAGVVSSKGAADPWLVNRPSGYLKVLGTHDKLTINVSFSPHASGHYEAQLELEVGAIGTPGTHQTVDLSADAIGTDATQTSFYSCASCSGQGAKARGWPIALAIVLVLRRRRRSH
ncbi:MAG: hypothetical protein JWO36_1205 [Myxococcales bacterium]|nr:hypothetical protein [Myxococcales bacterium]